MTRYRFTKSKLYCPGGLRGVRLSVARATPKSTGVAIRVTGVRIGVRISQQVAGSHHISVHVWIYVTEISCERLPANPGNFTELYYLLTINFFSFLQVIVLCGANWVADATEHIKIYLCSCFLATHKIALN